MTQSENTNAIDTKVLEFYRQLAFNQHSSVADQIDDIRGRNSVATYPVLPPLFDAATRVLEVGSGTGWLSNSISNYYESQVHGIDFNIDAVDFSRHVAQEMQLQTKFEQANLFDYEPRQKFDVVVSLGVLHHTRACHAALHRVCSKFVKPGGHVFIGLYHRYGREPFLNHFSRMQANGSTEQQLFEAYSELHSAIDDKTQLQSWFRDQVLHPHETQHTLKEMLPILEETGCELITTSLNRFNGIESEQALNDIFAAEVDQRKVGEERLKDKKYFPGFFLFLATRNR